MADEETKTTQTTDDAEQTEVQEGEPQTVTVSDADRDRAKKIGFSDDEIKALGDNLTTVLNATDRAVLSMSQPKETANGQTNQPANQESVDPIKMFGAKLDIPMDELDENVQKAIKTINDHYANILYGAAQAVGSLQQEIQEERKKSAEQRFSTMVNSLGEEWGDIISRPGEKDRLKAQYESMKAMHRQNFRQELDDGEAFNRALGSLHFNHLRELERRKLTGKVNQRTQKATERPRSRESEPETSGVEAAIGRIRKAKKAAL